MTFVSRIFGFIRDLVIATKFGSTAAADAFFVAFRIPNLQRRILGEGAVSAAFIPVFSEYMQTEKDQEAWKLASNLFNILSFMLLIFALGIYYLAPWIIALFAPGFNDDPEKFQLTVNLLKWMAPFLFFVGLAAFCMGILNTCKVFALSAVAPTLLNVCMISSALMISPMLETPIYGLVIGVVIGGALQFFIQLPKVLEKGFHFSTAFNWKHPGIIKMGKLIVPAVLGLAVYEINILIDTILASLLPEGSISYLYYANRLVQFPIGIFGVALGVALLPTLSDQAAKKNVSDLIKTLAFGIRLILFISIPATAGLILLRFPIINTLWERGEFTRASSEGTAYALLFYSLGLCAFAGTKVIVSAFYSLQDTMTPAKIGIYSMILNIVFCLVLMGPFQHGGLALATSLSALFNVSSLLYILKKRLGRMGGRNILRSTIKLMFSTFVMGLFLIGFNQMFFDPQDSTPIKLLCLSGNIVLGSALFYFISHLMKNEELAFLIKLIRERKARTSDIPPSIDD